MLQDYRPNTLLQQYHRLTNLYLIGSPITGVLWNWFYNYYYILKFIIYVYLLQQNKNAAQFKILIEDKDSLIKELRDEGEKLSKQHLNLNNIIKKLRVAEKESLKTINKYK